MNEVVQDELMCGWSFCFEADAKAEVQPRSSFRSDVTASTSMYNVQTKVEHTAAI